MSHAHAHENPNPRRYAGPTIDTHAHWYPQAWIDLAFRLCFARNPTTLHWKLEIGDWQCIR